MKYLFIGGTQDGRMEWTNKDEVVLTMYRMANCPWQREVPPFIDEQKTERYVKVALTEKTTVFLLDTMTKEDFIDQLVRERKYK